MDNKRRQNIEEIFKTKEKFHKDLAKLSFEKKIEILVRLQEIANSIRGSRTQKSRVWKIEN